MTAFYSWNQRRSFYRSQSDIYYFGHPVYMINENPYICIPGSPPIRIPNLVVLGQAVIELQRQQTDRRTDRQTDGQTDGQTDRQTDRPTELR